MNAGKAAGVVLVGIGVGLLAHALISRSRPDVIPTGSTDLAADPPRVVVDPVEDLAGRQFFGLVTDVIPARSMAGFSGRSMVRFDARGVADAAEVAESSRRVRRSHLRGGVVLRLMWLAIVAMIALTRAVGGEAGRRLVIARAAELRARVARAVVAGLCWTGDPDGVAVVRSLVAAVKCYPARGPNLAIVPGQFAVVTRCAM